MKRILFSVLLIGLVLMGCAQLGNYGTKESPTAPALPFTPTATSAPTATPCVIEGQSLGPVIPDNTIQCCPGLVPYIPEQIVGTRGTCYAPENVPKTTANSEKTKSELYSALAKQCQDLSTTKDGLDTAACCKQTLETIQSLNADVPKDGQCKAGTDLITARCVGGISYCAAATPERIGVANPAGTHCANLGYTEAFQDEGTQCTFTDGSACDEWDFFRGICGQDFSACDQKNGKITTGSGRIGSGFYQFGLCTFADGSQCGEGELTDGTCKAGQCKAWTVKGCQS
ncbi:DUF333 domain-containing protein [Candidatus Micrarchaeota archaeon]|nr:DUF333 domain-containing protein [Candidatus Micrarchaeota archaeon]